MNGLQVYADYIPELGFSSRDFGSKYHNLYSTTPCLMRFFSELPSMVAILTDVKNDLLTFTLQLPHDKTVSDGLYSLITQGEITRLNTESLLIRFYTM
jgi:hypothetical protein